MGLVWVLNPFWAFAGFVQKRLRAGKRFDFCFGFGVKESWVCLTVGPEVTCRFNMSLLTKQIELANSSCQSRVTASKLSTMRNSTSQAQHGSLALLLTVLLDYSDRHVRCSGPMLFHKRRSTP